VKVGCVVLTTGARPTELGAALASVRAQRGVEVALAVVHNAGPDDTPPEVGDATLVSPGRNLGIPAGRNAGVRALPDADLVLFLDDDAVLVGDDLLAAVAARFREDARIGVVTMRLVDPVTGRTERRHVPRLRVGDPSRSSWVTTFLGGACVVRADAYRAVGGLPEEFVYAHEETSLAWRLLDRGYRIWYAGQLCIAHPAAAPARHEAYHYRTARNRVLLARKHLPALLGVLYVMLWAVLGTVRDRSALGASARGFLDGARYGPVERRPISWRTVWRMTRLGRPPLL
jgi:GT2 family glycosyltransferase